MASGATNGNEAAPTRFLPIFLPTPKNGVFSLPIFERRLSVLTLI